MTTGNPWTFPTDRPAILGVVGDSVTQRGSFASVVTNSWVELVRTRIAAQCPQGVTRIDSVGHHDAYGNTCLGTIDTYPSGCDLVLVGLGTNDCRQQDSSGNWVYSPSQTYASAQTVYSTVAAQNPGAVVFGLGVWDQSMLTWYNAGSRVVRWDALIGERCHEAGGIWVSVSDLWDYSPNRLPTGVAAFGGFQTDGFHPNDAGHAAIAARAINALRLP